MYFITKQSMKKFFIRKHTNSLMINSLYLENYYCIKAVNTDTWNVLFLQNVDNCILNNRKFMDIHHTHIRTLKAHCYNGLRFQVYTQMEIS